MAHIFELNTPTHRRAHVDWMKQSFEYIFRNLSDVSIGIICDVPSITDSFGDISILCLIDIPFIEGKRNYYCWQKDGKKRYLYSLCIGFRIIVDDNIVEVNDDSYKSNDGAFCFYEEQVHIDSDRISRAIHGIIEGYFECELFDWIYSRNIATPSIHNYAIANSISNLEEVIIRAANRKIDLEKGDYTACKCFNLEKFHTDQQENKLALFTNKILEGINERSKIGVLTKKKLDQICDTRYTKTAEKIYESQGQKLCVISGKAGCGKTMAILKAMYYILRAKHRVRLLTYNHLLVNDLTQLIRNIPGVNSKNASIWTLHKFMYERSKDLHVIEYLTNSRKEELVNILIERIGIAEKMISNYLLNHRALPSLQEVEKSDGTKYMIHPNELILRDCGIEVLETDKTEILEYLNFVVANSLKTSDERSQEYLQSKISKLAEIKPGEYFVEDYNKVLETMYSMLDDTHKFYEENDIRHRRLFLSNIRMKSFLNGEEGPIVEEEEFEELIKHAKGSAKWSNTIFVDEAQDCNNYEKLILMKIRGGDHLVVATGGKDQLIRSSKELNWSISDNNIPLSTLSLTLPRRSHRQKGNLISFINEFANYYQLGTTIESDAPLDDRGRVIIDLRKSDEGSMPMDMVNEFRIQGVGSGCTPYESMMMLLPEVGYTKKTISTNTHISDEDVISSSVSSSERHLNIPEIPGINVWSGVDSQKSKLEIANQNQTRFIYYDSCRGLEAWTVLCLDLDSFYYTKRNSNEANTYASQNLDFFTTAEELQNRYALIWCYMAFTRAMDTLYIRIKTPQNEFSKKLIEIAEKCEDRVEILRSPEPPTLLDELPF